MNVFFNKVAKLSLIFVNSKECLELTEMNYEMVFNRVKNLIMADIFFDSSFKEVPHDAFAGDFR
jgi:hypothetical protein